MINILNFINGRLQPAQNNSFFEGIEPAYNRPFSQIADSTEADVDLAVAAANAAFPAWSTCTPQVRAAALNRLADLIEARLEDFAIAESRDSGKPVELAKTVDIPRSISNLRFFAAAATQFSSESFPMDDGTINYTVRRPLGVVTCISPWNLPLYLFTWKIAPALAAGNCVVAKPSEVTPLTAFMLAELCNEAGFPAGVINIIHGSGPNCGAPMVAHSGVKAVSFTGSTRAGRDIAAVCAPKFRKVSLELGGKNPNIIFADCNFEEAVSTSVRSSFSNQGQICLCGSRIFIEKSIYEKFRTAFLARVADLKVGNPADPTSNMGAVVSEMHYNKILSYIELAKEEGGTIAFGGNRVNLEGDLAKGFFIQPTVIENLPYTARCNQEEIFGPVVTLTPFETEEEVITYANSTEYGLAASVWTQDITRSHRIAGRLESGIVWLNCWMLRDLRTPFGGVKNSGIGREGGWEAMRFFTDAKSVTVKI